VLGVPRLVGRKHRERHCNDTDGRYRRRRRTPLRRATQQPDRLRRDEKEREVVRREREASCDRPCRDRTPRTRTDGSTQRDQRESAEQDKQRIGARFLRIPDEEWTDRHESRRDERRPRRDQLTGCRIRRGHRGRPDRCRQRARAGLTRAEEL
jgi:hypothetical protein